MHNCICYYCYYVIWGVKDAPKLFSFVIVCVHDRFMFLYVYSASCNKSIKYYIEYYKYNKFLAKSHGVNAGPLCKGFQTSDHEENVVSQSTEMSPLVSMLFWTFLNPLKF